MVFRPGPGHRSTRTRPDGLPSPEKRAGGFGGGLWTRLVVRGWFISGNHHGLCIELGDIFRAQTIAFATLITFLIFECRSGESRLFCPARPPNRCCSGSGPSFILMNTALNPYSTPFLNPADWQLVLGAGLLPT